MYKLVHITHLSFTLFPHPTPSIQLSQQSQPPQGHVELLVSAPAVVGVEEDATSLLADVGVIVLAAVLRTAVPTLVQPAQTVSVTQCSFTYVGYQYQVYACHTMYYSLLIICP